MSDEVQPWERLSTESNLWYLRFEVFRLLGPSRSIEAAYREECEAKSSKVRRPHRRWYDVAKEHRWKERAEAWDAAITAQARAEKEAKIIEILNSGFALKHERVEALNKIAALLEKELMTDDKRWLPDVKQIGSGENAERIDIVRFNSPIIEQFRGILDDLAKEVGERVEKKELTGRNGGPIEHEQVIVYVPDNGRNPHPGD